MNSFWRISRPLRMHPRCTKEGADSGVVGASTEAGEAADVAAPSEAAVAVDPAVGDGDGAAGG